MAGRLLHVFRRGQVGVSCYGDIITTAAAAATTTTTVDEIRGAMTRGPVAVVYEQGRNMIFLQEETAKKKGVLMCVVLFLASSYQIVVVVFYVLGRYIRGVPKRKPKNPVAFQLASLSVVFPTLLLSRSTPR